MVKKAIISTFVFGLLLAATATSADAGFQMPRPPMGGGNTDTAHVSGVTNSATATTGNNTQDARQDQDARGSRSVARGGANYMDMWTGNATARATQGIAANVDSCDCVDGNHFRFGSDRNMVRVSRVHNDAVARSGGNDQDARQDQDAGGSHHRMMKRTRMMHHGGSARAVGGDNTTLMSTGNANATADQWFMLNVNGGVGM